MTVLSVGSIGALVKSWELFLRGRGLLTEKEVDQSYTEVTAEATSIFQEHNSLDIDGKVGPQTLAAARKLGYSTDIKDPQLVTPPGVVPLNYTRRQDLLGTIVAMPAPTSGNPEGVRITNGWQSEYLVKVHIPQLKGVLGAPASGDIFWNKKGTKQIVDLFESWEAAGLMKNVISWAGSWAPRYVRGSRTNLSNHTWASAFDINAAWNGLGCMPAPEGSKGSVRELVPLAIKHGFYWGGFGWENQGSSPRRDGMHFEIRTLIP
jgi:hypothetical protein